MELNSCVLYAIIVCDIGQIPPVGGNALFQRNPTYEFTDYLLFSEYKRIEQLAKE